MSPGTLQIYNTFLALLALTALSASMVLLVARLVRGPQEALRPGLIWLPWLVALVATVGSLVYSEVVHFVPCRLCWFQRIAMYPLAVILLVGAVRRQVSVKYYTLPLALAGLAISVWHNVIQLFPSLEGGACEPLNPCSGRYVDVFGFVTIPFMAGSGFALIAVLTAFYLGSADE